MATRGSVIPLFIHQILNNEPISITDPNMTRFLMSLDEAVDLVEDAFLSGNTGEIIVRKSPACTIHTLAKALISIFKVPNHKINIIGTRHGEKLHEVLLSREELFSAKETEFFYRIPCDKRELETKISHEVKNILLRILKD